jgi:predicted nucleic acid-binding protein
MVLSRRTLVAAKPTHRKVRDVWSTRRKLLVAYSISGVQVHDARLIAAMRVQGVKRILTFKATDFVRYADVEAVHPRNVSVER